MLTLIVTGLLRAVRTRWLPNPVVELVETAEQGDGER